MVMGGIPPLPSHASDKATYIRNLIPTSIRGDYQNGRLIRMVVRGRNAYLVEPIQAVDSKRRWIWECPFWLGIHDGHGKLHHDFYVESFLKAGFHVAGIDVGTSCGSPKGAEVCHAFYELLTSKHHLNKKARMIGQSNGGLIAYAWAFRHPDCVDRIAGICPATDFRTWPTLPNVVTFPDKTLGFDLSLDELQRRITEFNPTDNLKPLSSAGVQLFHVHGDKDELVPYSVNSVDFLQRYREMGGHAELETLKGLAHGGQELYESRRLVKFLLE